jgi:hypothetical protein
MDGAPLAEEQRRREADGHRDQRDRPVDGVKVHRGKRRVYVISRADAGQRLPAIRRATIWAIGAEMSQTNLIFIGIKGTALALDRATGQEVWRTKLKGADFANVVLLDGDLFATADGELFCLEASTGRIRWQNPLKGLGLGLVTIAAPDSRQAVLMREKQRRDQAAAAPAMV